MFNVQKAVEKKKWEDKRKAERPWERFYQYIRQRCNDKNHSSYKNYGGKGILSLMTDQDMHFLWLRDKAYEMKRPSIDRIDSAGHYELHNCRFIEAAENTRRASVGRDGHMSKKKDIDCTSMFKGVCKRSKDGTFTIGFKFTKQSRRGSITNIKDEVIAAAIYDLIVFDVCGKDAWLNFGLEIPEMINKLKSDKPTKSGECDCKSGYNQVCDVCQPDTITIPRSVAEAIIQQWKKDKFLSCGSVDRFIEAVSQSLGEK